MDIRLKISKFFQTKTAPGVLLALAVVLALFMENCFLSGFYEGLKNTQVVLQVGMFVIDKPLLLWINDGLMAVFFLLVGLEIKRELISGALSSYRQVILPAIAALGGLVMPALIYVYLNLGDAVALSGWAIPAATDIAFVLGVILLLGDRVPRSLKVCIVALAVIDDLAAIIIIAIFYTAEPSIALLMIATSGVIALVLLNLCKVTRLDIYMVVGIIIWACVLKSGVHATIAGVAIGFAIPLKARNKDGRSPLIVLEHTLRPWVNFMVLPAFAFVNAGVNLSGLSLGHFTEPVTLGIILGLFIGKQLGILSITFIASKLRVVSLPYGVSWLQFYGVAVLAGIGFTMSLFIGTLAFADIDHAISVRLGVLIGSILSAVVGSSILIFAANKKRGIAHKGSFIELNGGGG